MEQIFIIIMLLILAETTYLTSTSSFKTVNSHRSRLIFVDTSVLIDGRIIAVASSGFVDGILAIPRSVIGELQFLADNADAEKRSRARHGLDIVSELQALPDVRVEIYRDSLRAKEGVDSRLLALAKKRKGLICTVDYNLNKVAQVEDIRVLNVNDLAMSLRMAYLPGEKMNLELTNKGQEPHQAVGHLADGTMVVVEQANKFIGQKVEIEFIRSLQTAAGKMMFAKMVGNKVTQSKQKKTDKVMPKSSQPKAYHAVRKNSQQTRRQNIDAGSSPHRKSKADEKEASFVDLANK